MEKLRFDFSLANALLWQAHQIAASFPRRDCERRWSVVEDWMFYRVEAVSQEAFNTASEAFIASVELFGQDVTKWEKDAAAAVKAADKARGPKKEKTRDEIDKESLTNREIAAFRKKTDGAESIAESYHNRQHRFVVNIISDGDFYGIAGVMSCTTKDDSIKIENIATHPLTANAGVLLIKHAVQFSVEKGKGGRLTLFDASGGNFYRNLGFRYTDGNDMVLEEGALTIRD